MVAPPHATQDTPLLLFDFNWLACHGVWSDTRDIPVTGHLLRCLSLWLTAVAGLKPGLKPGLLSIRPDRPPAGRGDWVLAGRRCDEGRLQREPSPATENKKGSSSRSIVEYKGSHPRPSRDLNAVTEVNMEGISRRELASRHGISETAVRKHIANGNLVGAVLPDGSLDPDIAARLLVGTIQKGTAVPVALRTAKTRRLRAQVAGLLDKVEAMRQMVISTEDADKLLAGERQPTIVRLRRIPNDFKKAAGMNARDAARTMNALVHEVLEDLAAEPADYGEERSPAPSVDARPDLSTMSPNGLAALRINLSAELMEMKQALANGRARSVVEVLNEWEAKLAASKSLLLALPGRLAPHMSVHGAKPKVRAEVEEIIGSLP